MVRVKKASDASDVGNGGPGTVAVAPSRTRARRKKLIEVTPEEFCAAFEKTSIRTIFHVLQTMDAHLDALCEDPEMLKKINPGQYASAVGTLIDKQQLLKKEPTAIVDCTERFEDL